MSFINLENAYNRINREALWQVLRMYDVGAKNFRVKLRSCMLIVQFMSK